MCGLHGRAYVVGFVVGFSAGFADRFAFGRFMHDDLDVCERIWGLWREFTDVQRSYIEEMIKLALSDSHRCV